MNDRTLDLIERLFADDAIDLPVKTREAFSDFRAILLTNGNLTIKQNQWVQNVAHQHGLIGDPGAANLFSNMDPKKRADQLARAAKVKLPWES